MKALVVGVVMALGAAVPGEVSDVESVLRQALEDTGVPGFSAVVTRGDEVVHVGGYGEVAADTPMRVASVSKSFTAAAVMALVDDGKIALDGAVAEQLPGFVMADPRAERITVRQLLNQTSGLADFTIDVTALERARSLEEFVGGLRGGGLDSEPGVKYRYCNANYDLAARLVEVESGRPFAEFVRDRVFRPLGMMDSSVGGQTSAGFNSVFGAWVERQGSGKVVVAGGPPMWGGHGTWLIM